MTARDVVPSAEQTGPVPVIRDDNDVLTRLATSTPRLDRAKRVREARAGLQRLIQQLVISSDIGGYDDPVRELAKRTKMNTAAIQHLLSANPEAPWPAYKTLLAACATEPKAVTDARWLWQEIVRFRHAPAPPFVAGQAAAQATTNPATTNPHTATTPAPQTTTTPPPPPSIKFDPTTVTPVEEIRASSTAEFAELLRMLRVRAGVPVTEIAKRSGIARSQIYEMTKTGRDKLPTRSGQVVALARACGLHREGVDRLTTIWTRLSNNDTSLGYVPTEVMKNATENTTDENAHSGPDSSEMILRMLVTEGMTRNETRTWVDWFLGNKVVATIMFVILVAGSVVNEISPAVASKVLGIGMAVGVALLAVKQIKSERQRRLSALSLLDDYQASYRRAVGLQDGWKA